MMVRLRVGASVAVFLFRLGWALSMLTVGSSVGLAEEGNPTSGLTDTTCERSLENDPESRAVFAAANQFRRFFGSVQEGLFERDFFLEVSRLALLAKEHVLMLGPPGTAKSMGVDLIIDNVVDRETSATSVFKIQMTPETSLSETHGVIDYRRITEENIQTRMWEQGILSAKLVFIDEFFDARANAIRNNLMALNEREHAQGRERIRGITETGFAASNRYLHEVYEKAGDDGPKAIIDRFAFVAFVPGEIHELNSALNLVQQIASAGPERLTFQDLDLLRTKLGEVVIPDYLAQMLTLLFTRMKSQTEALEDSERRSYADKKRAGQTPLPPYRATKYYSPRTLRKAGKILRAIVVDDWIEKKGERSLTANSEDVARLIGFFTMNSLTDEAMGRMVDSALNPYEKVQIMTVERERQMFRETYQGINTEISTRMAELTEFAVDLDSAVTDALRADLVSRMIKRFLEVRENSQAVSQIADLNETQISDQYLLSTLESWLRELVDGDLEAAIESHQAEERKAIRRQNILERWERRKEKRRQQEAMRISQDLSAGDSLGMNEPAGLPAEQFVFGGPANLGVTLLKTDIESMNEAGLDPLVWRSEDGGTVEFQYLIGEGQPTFNGLDLAKSEVLPGMTYGPGFDDPSQIESLIPLGSRAMFAWYDGHAARFDTSGVVQSVGYSGFHPGTRAFISQNYDDGLLWWLDLEYFTLHRTFVAERETELIELADYEFVRNKDHLQVDFSIFREDLKGDTQIYGHKSSTVYVETNVEVDGDRQVRGYWIDTLSRKIGLGFSLKGPPSVFARRRMHTFADGVSALGTLAIFPSADPDIPGEMEFRFFPFDPTLPQRVWKIRNSLDLVREATEFDGWDLAPDGSFLVTFIGNALWGLTRSDGAMFEIPIESGQIVKYVEFVDQHHLLIRYADSFEVRRLPTFGISAEELSGMRVKSPSEPFSRGSFVTSLYQTSGVPHRKATYSIVRLGPDEFQWPFLTDNRLIGKHQPGLVHVNFAESRLGAIYNGPMEDWESLTSAASGGRDSVFYWRKSDGLKADFRPESLRPILRGDAGDNVVISQNVSHGVLWFLDRERNEFRSIDSTSLRELSRVPIDGFSVRSDSRRYRENWARRFLFEGRDQSMVLYAGEEPDELYIVLPDYSSGVNTFRVSIAEKYIEPVFHQTDGLRYVLQRAPQILGAEGGLSQAAFFPDGMGGGDWKNLNFARCHFSKEKANALYSFNGLTPWLKGEIETQPWALATDGSYVVGWIGSRFLALDQQGSTFELPIEPVSDDPAAFGSPTRMTFLDSERLFVEYENGFGVYRILVN